MPSNRSLYVINEEEWQGKNLGVIKLVFGNIYEPVKNVNYKQLDGPDLCHRWMIFLSINNDSKLTSKYIDSVTYHLPQVYKNHKITSNSPPFFLSRTAYFPFAV